MQHEHRHHRAARRLLKLRRAGAYPLKAPSVFGFKRVQILSDNAISRIQGLEVVPLLRRLNLNGNRIRHLDNLSHLKQLEHLFLTDNVISELLVAGNIVVDAVLMMMLMMVLSCDIFKHAPWMKSRSSRPFPLSRYSLCKYATLVLPLQICNTYTSSLSPSETSTAPPRTPSAITPATALA